MTISLLMTLNRVNDSDGQRAGVRDLTGSRFGEALDISQKRVPSAVDALETTQASACLSSTAVGAFMNQKSLPGNQLPCSRAPNAVETVRTIAWQPVGSARTLVRQACV